MPDSSIVTTEVASFVVSNLIRSDPGTNRQPGPGTIGGDGDSGGTLIHPSLSGMMLNAFGGVAPGLFTHTSIVRLNGNGRPLMNDPMFVGWIAPGPTPLHVGVMGVLPSWAVWVVSNRYSISGAPLTRENPPL